MKILEQFKNLSQSNYKRGVVEIDASACTACRECVRLCPASALKIVGKKPNRHCAMDPVSDCISCAACCAVCEAEAIKLTRLWQVPDGAYRTDGKSQTLGRESYPRIFNDKRSYE